jgi:hypothetical protein
VIHSSIRSTGRARALLARALGLGLGMAALALAPSCGSGGGSGGSGGGTTTTGTGGDCGECLRAVNCVKQCGGEVLQSGCCPCPEGTFDDLVCSMDGGPDSGDAATD